MFLPPDPNSAIFERFHELSIRRLIKEESILNHLADRGFTEESIVNFRYGYSDELLMEKMLKEFGKEALAETKLWMLDEEKGYDFPYFNERIIIPWMKNGRYVTFQGRAIGEAKKRYIFLPSKDPCLYHSEDLSKRGRVYLTEGAFKRDRLKQEGANATAIPSASQFKKFLQELRLCEDLWIVLDSDREDEQGKKPGQDAALELAKQLNKCTVVTLPLPEDVDKMGVDDFIEEYGYEALEHVKTVAYERGVEAKPTSLSVLVSDWKKRVEASESIGGFLTGFPRFDNTLGGFHNGSLTFLAGAAHMGKTTALEEFAIRLRRENQNLSVDYYSNDDSLFTTLTRWVAKIGRLSQKDCRYPSVAFADNPEMHDRFEAACRRLSEMSDRLKILDRSYNISLERLKADLLLWRKENPRGEKALFIDAFTKTKTNRDGDFRDDLSLGIYKSSLLKEIAQEIHIPVVVTNEVPKLFGKRPNSWNMKGSSSLEFDADLMLLFFMDSHVKGMNRTSLKVEYNDGEINPIIEVTCAKDKVSGVSRWTNLFELDKRNSRLKELIDMEYDRMMPKVYESESAEWRG